MATNHTNSLDEQFSEDQSSSKNKFTTVSRAVQIWLLIGVVMVFVQVIVGGITRLTDSGLSITEWKVIQGTLPPMNEADWTVAFEEYKVMAKKQFETLHADMTLSEFKVIFFWEYIHRLWARTMGFVFLIPFLIFVVRKQMPKWLAWRLGIIVLLAMLAATFGWIMVKSGLNEDTRTWVSAYKLAIHLSIATAIFAYLFWIYLMAKQPVVADAHFKRLNRFANLILGVVLLQIVFGGLMAGMRAGLIHAHWPIFVKMDNFMHALNADANMQGMVDYETRLFPKAIVQILHRTTAYLLTGLIIWFFFQARKINGSLSLQRGNYALFGLLFIQFTLGVLTVLNCIGRVPIMYGSLHQGVALILLAAVLYLKYQTQKTRY